MTYKLTFQGTTYELKIERGDDTVVVSFVNHRCCQIMGSVAVLSVIVAEAVTISTSWSFIPYVNEGTTIRLETLNGLALELNHAEELLSKAIVAASKRLASW